MPSQSVLVIGGGLAGLSSAVALADAGLQVRLIEKRPHLGGRATSYTLPDGSEVDNCQHVTLGCCTNLADFYNRVGAAASAAHAAVVFIFWCADDGGQAGHRQSDAGDRDGGRKSSGHRRHFDAGGDRAERA